MGKKKTSEKTETRCKTNDTSRFGKVGTMVDNLASTNIEPFPTKSG